MITNHANPLLAQNAIDFLDSIQNRLQTGPETGGLMLFAGSVVAFIVFVALVARFVGRGKKPKATEARDYLTMAVDLLELSEENRRDLFRIAREAQLSVPLSMLLTPRNFGLAVRAAGLAEHDADLRQRLNALSLQLFDVPLE